MIVFNPTITTDKKVKFKGYIPKILPEKKINQTVVFTTGNTRSETFTGTMQNYTIDVQEMKEEHYKNLMYFFRTGVEFTIKCNDVGYSESNKVYTFDGETVGLSPVESKTTNEILYSGSIAITATYGI